jgi:hypothetical protein
MHASLRALLGGLIDYAGLFPPARLPLDEAIRNYSRYQTQPEAWMLGRFICPASRLDELDRYVDARFSEGPGLAISVLAGRGNTRAEFQASLRQDLRAATAFQQKHGSGVRLEVLEIKLPADRGEMAGELLQETVMGASETIESAMRRPVTAFYEANLGPGWPGVLSDALSGIALANVARAAEHNTFSRPAGFKLRCGGLEPSAFPAPDQVAEVISQCRERGLALKATAGLHHPLRRFDSALGTHMHGFVNLFGAAVLAHACRLNEAQIKQMIEDEDAASFAFTDEGFRWRDLRTSTAEIVSAREQFATSFGSCSFDEPREDLRALGWL